MQNDFRALVSAATWQQSARCSELTAFNVKGGLRQMAKDVLSNPALREHKTHGHGK